MVYHLLRSMLVDEGSTVQAVRDEVDEDDKAYAIVLNREIPNRLGGSWDPTSLTGAPGVIGVTSMCFETGPSMPATWPPCRKRS
jgi:hypothetical protein